MSTNKSKNQKRGKKDRARQFLSEILSPNTQNVNVLLSVWKKADCYTCNWGEGVKKCYQ